PAVPRRAGGSGRPAVNDWAPAVRRIPRVLPVAPTPEKGTISRCPPRRTPPPERDLAPRLPAAFAELRDMTSLAPLLLVLSAAPRRRRAAARATRLLREEDPPGAGAALLQVPLRQGEEGAWRAAAGHARGDAQGRRHRDGRRAGQARRQPAAQGPALR